MNNKCCHLQEASKDFYTEKMAVKKQCYFTHASAFAAFFIRYISAISLMRELGRYYDIRSGYAGLYLGLALDAFQRNEVFLDQAKEQLLNAAK